MFRAIIGSLECLPANLKRVLKWSATYRYTGCVYPEREKGPQQSDDPDLQVWESQQRSWVHGCFQVGILPH